VRHLFLHYPDDPRVLAINHEQFLVGSELLVAPVLDPGVTEVNVYLPKGEWVHLWRGTTFGSTESGTEITIPAPLGEPAVFYRKGSSVGEHFREMLGELIQE
ncbi:MAG: alpha-glucosidase, partial [Calditrichaeota bacterium]|nr:alpha-glucosidase [Calditrichota bacterium]